VRHHLMLHGRLNMLRSKGQAIALGAGALLAMHGGHADFRFDLGCGTGKKSP